MGDIAASMLVIMGKKWLWCKRLALYCTRFFWTQGPS